MKIQNKKVLFFLATEKGYEVLNTLIKHEQNEYIAGVVSFREVNMRKDYFEDIKNVAIANQIPFFEWKNVKKDLVNIISDYNVTNCIAISWRYILPLSINDKLKDNLIVFHDSLLPRYRGFAPLVTAMLNGEKEVGVSVLFAEEKADCGDIILQEKMKIVDDMYIECAVSKMAQLYANVTMKLMELILKDDIKARKQNENEATYSIWRDEEDYWIEWFWSSEKINRYIHCLGYPYKGAKANYNGKIIRIIKSEIVADVDFEIRTPGKIWGLSDNKPVIVCGSGLIRILEAYYEEDNQPVLFTKLRERLHGDKS